MGDILNIQAVTFSTVMYERVHFGESLRELSQYGDLWTFKSVGYEVRTLR